MTTTVAESRKPKTGAKLRDRWVGNMVRLVGIENALSRPAERRIKAMVRRVVDTIEGVGTASGMTPAELLESDYFPGMTHREAFRVFARKQVTETMTAIRNEIAVETREFVSRWFGVAFRTMFGAMTPREVLSLRGHIDAMILRRSLRRFTSGESATVAEADPVTAIGLGVRIDAAQMIQQVMRSVGLSEVDDYLRSENPNWYQGRADRTITGTFEEIDAVLTQWAEEDRQWAEALEALEDKLSRLDYQTDEIIRTHIQTVASDIEDIAGDYVSPMLEGYIRVAILDSRTCLRCGRLAGTVYGPDEDKPDATLHNRCRCSYLPLLKGREPVEVQNFDAWLRRQSAFDQRLILGKARYGLFKSGVNASRFVNNRSRILRVKELPKPDAIPEKWKTAPRRRKHRDL